MNICNDSEERTRAFKLCREHLYGAWADVLQSETIIGKLSGGMSNLLYYCALPDTTETHSDEPREVLLRIYGPSLTNVNLQLEVFNKLASENLGPKLYSTFEGGRLEEFLKSNPLAWDEMTTESVANNVAKNIAAIHKLDMTSLKKDPNWLVDNFNQFHDYLQTHKEKTSSFTDKTLDSTKLIAQSMLTIDFGKEIDYMTRLILNSWEPLVFSHNDLHQNNILLLHDNDKSPNDRIILIDFEYCSYNYRLFDIANHLNEWCFDYTGTAYPYFNASVDRFPSIETRKRFMIQYLKHSEDDTDIEDDRVRLDYLLGELQVLMMASNMLWTLWAIKSACTSKIDFGYWEMSRMKWTFYLLCKEQFEKRSFTTSAGDSDIIYNTWYSRN